MKYKFGLYSFFFIWSYFLGGWGPKKRQGMDDMLDAMLNAMIDTMASNPPAPSVSVCISVYLSPSSCNFKVPPQSDSIGKSLVQPPNPWTDPCTTHAPMPCTAQLARQPQPHFNPT